MAEDESRDAAGDRTAADGPDDGADEQAVGPADGAGDEGAGHPIDEPSDASADDAGDHGGEPSAAPTGGDAATASNDADEEPEPVDAEVVGAVDSAVPPPHVIHWHRTRSRVRMLGIMVAFTGILMFIPTVMQMVAGPPTFESQEDVDGGTLTVEITGLPVIDGNETTADIFILDLNGDELSRELNVTSFDDDVDQAAILIRILVGDDVLEREAYVPAGDDVAWDLDWEDRSQTERLGRDLIASSTFWAQTTTFFVVSLAALGGGGAAVMRRVRPLALAGCALLFMIALALVLMGGFSLMLVLITAISGWCGWLVHKNPEVFQPEPPETPSP